MVDLEELKKAVSEAVEENLPSEMEVCQFIYDHPELGNEEFESTAFLAEKLAELGFTVTYPYAGVPTAIRADLKCGEGPVVAFLGEYDALPGYGPEKNQNAHACGHCWIAATCYGACAALAACRDKLHGTISFIGAPAEETTGGKIDVIRNHGYDDVDAAMQIHLGGRNSMDVHFLAMDSLEFTFHGKAAHAAGQPELGINALDAVMLTYSGINCLRQHVTSDVRIHGIVTEGGKAVNTVPDLGQCRFYVRAARRAYLNELKERVINIARGAALMTGCTMEYRYFENPFDDLIMNPVLQESLHRNLDSLGITDYFTYGDGGVGSSDVGNVSQICPTVYFEMATGMDPEIAAHMPEFLPGVTGEPYASVTLKLAAKAMAMTAVEVFEKSGMKEEMKKSFINR